MYSGLVYIPAYMLMFISVIEMKLKTGCKRNKLHTEILSHFLQTFRFVREYLLIREIISVTLNLTGIPVLTSIPQDKAAVKSKKRSLNLNHAII